LWKGVEGGWGQVFSCVYARMGAAQLGGGGGVRAGRTSNNVRS